MDSCQNKSRKSQRNSRNKKDKNKVHGEEIETCDSCNPEINNKGSDPQPQRENRRQRNEPTPVNSSVDKTPPSVPEKKETQENVVIDHSSLKRETEEIAKLKKKFTKREITSNWHRYSAPEGVVESSQSEEKPAADFSDLIHVSATGGGHLQLKEEQEWSAATGAELSGYFALDLKLLSQSLACVPLYEQLRLPKHIFTEEEVKHFVDLADEAKKCYNPDKIQSKSFVEKASILNKDIDNTENIVNILNVEESTEKVINLVEMEEIPNEQLTPTLDITEKSASVITTINLNVENEIKDVAEKPKTQEHNKNIIISNNNTTTMKIETDFLRENSAEIPDIENSSGKQTIITTETVLNNKCNDNLETLYKKPSLEQFLLLNDTKSPTNENSMVNASENSGSENGFHLGVINSTNTGESKDKRIKRHSNKKSPVNEVIVTKISDKLEAVRLDDEDNDDLDFLLTLKKPVSVKTTKCSKSPPIKDSTFLPKAVPAQPPTQQTHSELDDWLDSVLQN